MYTNYQNKLDVVKIYYFIHSISFITHSQMMCYVRLQKGLRENYESSRVQFSNKF